MTTALNGHTNGHTVPAQWGTAGPRAASAVGADTTPPPTGQQEPAPAAAPEPELPAFATDIPTAAALDATRQRGADAIALQDSDELHDWKSWDAIEADRDVAVQHQDALRELRTEQNAAEIARQRRELNRDTRLADQAHRDELDANRARAHLRRMHSPVSYLAAQMRARKAVLTLTTAPAVFAIIMGALNVAYALGIGVLGLTITDPFLWALGGIELLFTAPLAGIMLLHATSNSRTPSSWRELRQLRFFGISAGLLGASVFVQAVPHLMLGQPVMALLSLGIPAGIVVSMSMLPKITGEFNHRISEAKTDAELTAEIGNLTGDQSKLVRQMRIVQAAIDSDTLPGQRDDNGIPSSTAARKALAASQGRAGLPDAMAVTTAMRVLRGVDT